jgi:cytoskeleton protein RodZ
MTTTRRSQTPRNGRATPPKNEEPVSITKPIPGTVSYADEPKVKMERIGDVLKRLREQRGDDLQYIADYLCIKRNFLEALEGSHYEQLPADAYVIGFLRSYANYLGTDGKEAIDRYRNEMAGRRNKPTLMLPTPISEGRTPSAIIMASAAVAALLIYALWYGLSTSDRTVVSKPPALPSTAVVETAPAAPPQAEAIVPPPPAVAAATPAPAASAPVTPSAIVIPPTTALAPPPADSGIMLSSAAPPTTTGLGPAIPVAANNAPAPAPVSKKAVEQATAQSQDTTIGGQVVNEGAKDSHLTIRAIQSSWVLITDNHGATIYDHVMKAGEVYRVPNKPGLSMTTGNGSGIAMTLDGSDLPRLATGNSHVMRNIPLDGDHLRNLPPTPDD